MIECIIYENILFAANYNQHNPRAGLLYNIMSDPFTPTYELENPTVNFFNMIDFRRFLVENKVIVTAVSFTIATYINELVKSFYDNLIFSFFNKDADGDKKNDLKHIFTYELNINGVPFKLGLFL